MEKIAEAVFTSAQYVTWHACFEGYCQTIADTHPMPPHTSHQIFEQIFGTSPHASETEQSRLSNGLLGLIHNAAMAAWRDVPLIPISQVIQGVQEEYAEVISRLLEAIKRTLGKQDCDNKLVKQLVYENVNSACRDILRGKYRDKSLNDMIRMFQDADPLASRLPKAVKVAVGAVLQRPVANKKCGCFTCGDPQHFALDCPM